MFLIRLADKLVHGYPNVCCVGSAAARRTVKSLEMRNLNMMGRVVGAPRRYSSSSPSANRATGLDIVSPLIGLTGEKHFLTSFLTSLSARISKATDAPHAADQ